MAGKTHRSQEPVYAGPTSSTSSPASALPIPKRSMHSLSGSGTQRNAERPRNGDEAVPVTSGNSHEGKKATSETKEQDEPVDTKPKATSTARPQRRVTFDIPTERINDKDEDKKRKQVSDKEELQRPHQVVIDRSEAQTTPPTTLAAPQAIGDHRPTIPIHIQRAPQALQQHLISQEIQITGQRLAACLAEWSQVTNQLLQICNKRLELILAKQQELRQQLRLDGIDIDIEQGQIPADTEVRQTSDSNGISNSNNGNSLAGISTSARQTPTQQSARTAIRNVVVPPKDSEDGEEAEEAE